MRFLTTADHKKWWTNRKIDWKKEYLATYNHPHRLWMIEQIQPLGFSSIFEIGCGPGANLAALGIVFPKVALGGADVNEEAIELARKTFPPSSLFEVASGDNLMMSDQSCDVVLTDMTLIYVGPRHIKKYLKEMVRVARRYIVISEFYHPSIWKRFRMTLAGRFTHNYPQLLEDLGCSDIMVRKMPSRLWPGAHDEEYRYLIMARV